MKLLTAALAATLLLTGCGTGENAADAPPSPSTFNLVGTITVEAGDASDGTEGGDCLTEGGYSDISTGAQVTIKNETGKVLAIGKLDPGHTAEVMTLPKFNSETVEIDQVPQAVTCIFGFSVASIPEGAKFYSVEVVHRGALQYTRADLANPLTLSLGS